MKTVSAVSVCEADKKAAVRGTTAYIAPAFTYLPISSEDVIATSIELPILPF